MMRARLADTLPLPSLSSCAQRVCLGARHAIAARSGEMPRARVSASPLPLAAWGGLGPFCERTNILYE